MIGWLTGFSSIAAESERLNLIAGYLVEKTISHDLGVSCPMIQPPCHILGFVAYFYRRYSQSVKVGNCGGVRNHVSQSRYGAFRGLSPGCP